jgi:hypothetical protein
VRLVPHLVAAALLLALPAPSYAARDHLVPSLGPVVRELPALQHGTREVSDFTTYTVPGPDCATQTPVGTAVRGERANYIGKRRGGRAATAVAVIGVQKYAGRHAADQVVLAVRSYTRACRGPHVAGTVRNRVKALKLPRRLPAGQRAVAYHVLSQSLAADGSVTDHLDQIWYVARSGKTVVVAVTGRRAGKPTLDQAVVLAKLGLHPR